MAAEDAAMQPLQDRFCCRLRSRELTAEGAAMQPLHDRVFWLQAVERVLFFLLFFLQVLNYGQSVFEGMKAQRTPSGSIVLFR
jgi:hypothetical protein